MSLPSQVVEQDALADRLLAEAAERRAAAAAEPVVVDEPPIVPDVTPPPAVVETPPVATDPPAPVVSEETWESRYRSLQGKYNAEVPPLLRKVKDLEARVKTLTEAPPKPAERLVTAEEIEKYGPDFLDVVRRAAEESFAPERAKLQSEISDLRGNVESTVNADNARAEAGFFADLSKAHSDWEAVNVTEGWRRWLGEYDPVARSIRQVLLDNAIATHDSEYVIDLLTRFKALNKARTPAPVVSPEPATSHGNPPPEEPTSKVWTRPMVQKFYRDLQRGVYTEAEGVKIEAEINAALAARAIK